MIKQTASLVDKPKYYFKKVYAYGKELFQIMYHYENLTSGHMAGSVFTYSEEGTSFRYDAWKRDNEETEIREATRLEITMFKHAFEFDTSKLNLRNTHTGHYIARYEGSTVRIMKVKSVMSHCVHGSVLTTYSDDTGRPTTFQMETWNVFDKGIFKKADNEQQLQYLVYCAIREQAGNEEEDA
jgi:hypothetical protein